MNKYELYNRNGSPICHKVGCRKHKKVISVFGGLFCTKHTIALGKIRTELTAAKNNRDRQLENYYRQLEIEFRKKCDPGHMYYKLVIEKELDRW